MSISVIIPAYNREKTIRRCLESVLDQSHPLSEIIVVDDDSKDSTCEIVKSHDDERISLIEHKTNKGSQASRNTGIKASRSDWICFLDSDDTWEKSKIEKQYEVLAKNQFDPYLVVHSNGWKYDIKTKKRVCYALPNMQEPSAYHSVLRHPGPLFQGIICSKRVLHEINFLDTGVVSHQEWDTSIRLAQKCRFYHIKEPLFTWYLNGGDTISGNNLNHIKGYEYIIRKFESDIKQLDNGEWWDNHLTALIGKMIRLDKNKDAKLLLDDFISKRSLYYFVSRLVIGFRLKNNISMNNTLVKSLYRMWNLKHHLQ